IYISLDQNLQIKQGKTKRWFKFQIVTFFYFLVQIFRVRLTIFSLDTKVSKLPTIKLPLGLKDFKVTALYEIISPSIAVAFFLAVTNPVLIVETSFNLNI
ncbi:hypothetical protein, partial [Sulfurimonas sp. NWX79]|uniref:hypothetical protein n=1 Tax=Sulfurimonas sp. NWX79 TaxID=2925412 RepID=UPI003204E499